MLLLLSICVTSSVYAQKQIDMADYGLTPGQDVTPVIYDILSREGKSDLRILFPKGDYHFYADKAFGKYHAITNHDNSYKYFAFPIIGGKNIEIDGGGSTFWFHGVVTPFLIEQSQNVSLKNFSVDWAEPFYVQGTVVASDSAKKYMDLKFTDFSKLKLEGDRLAIETNGIYLPFLGESMVFDPTTKAVAYKAQDYLPVDRSKRLKATKLSNDTYRMTGNFAKRPAPEGLIYVFKGVNGSNRFAPAIHLTDSRDFKANDITIHHAGGMGLVGEKSENIHIDNFNVVLPQGSERIVSTTADATHFCNCKGTLIIENCTFENMLDDATNVHGTYIRVAEVKSPRVVAANIVHYQQAGYNFAAVSDVVRFVESETILPIGDNRVVGVERINASYCLISFEKDIPATLKVGDGIENITWYPQLTFRNNIVRNNRARSILISTPNETLIEGNTFSSMMTSILFEGDLDFWFESGAVSNVVIRNNTFLDNCYGGNKGSVIWINPHQRRTIAGQPYERNIVIENNSFRTFDPSIVDARSVGGLIIRNNTIEASGTYPSIQPNMSTFTLKECIDSRIYGNKIKGKGTIAVNMDEISESSAKTK